MRNAHIIGKIFNVGEHISKKGNEYIGFSLLEKSDKNSNPFIQCFYFLGGVYKKEDLLRFIRNGNIALVTGTLRTKYNDYKKIVDVSIWVDKVEVIFENNKMFQDNLKDIEEKNKKKDTDILPFSDERREEDDNDDLGKKEKMKSELNKKDYNNKENNNEEEMINMIDTIKKEKNSLEDKKQNGNEDEEYDLFD